MTDAKQRLTHLIELASTDAPETRRTLAVELCDLLIDWPPHYPAAMREPFEALLEKTVRIIDCETRRSLIAKLASREAKPRAKSPRNRWKAASSTRRGLRLIWQTTSAWPAIRQGTCACSSRVRHIRMCAQASRSTIPCPS